MKNNVLIFCISLQRGGAERIISLLLKEFAEDENFSIHLVMMEGRIEYPIPSSVKITILSKSKKSAIRKLLELPFVSWQLKNYIKENSIDTVMSFLYRPNYINILSKIFTSKHKSIINVRSTTSRYLKEGLLGKINLFLIKTLFNRADMIVSNSNGVDEDLKALMQITTDTKVIYNPVDIQFIDSKKGVCEDIEFDFKEDKKYIISVGRLIPLKRNSDLLEAFYELQKDDDSLELIFLGEGILKADLIKKCENIGIENRVHFLGNVKNPFYYLNKSDLFVMNSQTEGFPNTLVEAMACGLLVISSDCKSGPREILLDEKYGLLYQVGNIKELIQKMRYYLYEDINRKKIKLNTRKRVEYFKINKIIEEYKEIV